MVATGQVVAVTGHRPQHLSLEDGYWIQAEFDRLIEKLAPALVISGMALGADTWWASVAINAGVPLAAYVPFPDQDARWRNDDRIFYRHLLDAADEVVVVSGHYHPGAFEMRNRAMVDNSDLLVAAWNGKTSGGTWNCRAYAIAQRRPIVEVDIRTRSTHLTTPADRDKLFP